VGRRRVCRRRGRGPSRIWFSGHSGTGTASPARPAGCAGSSHRPWLEDADNLPAPEVIAREIVEDLTAALAEFEAVAASLEAASTSGEGLAEATRRAAWLCQRPVE
jgi:hypothetical protein